MQNIKKNIVAPKVCICTYLKFKLYEKIDIKKNRFPSAMI